MLTVVCSTCRREYDTRDSKPPFICNKCLGKEDRNVVVPYVETMDIGYEMVYSQEDHEEFVRLYDLMKHANKRIINLIRRNRELEEKIKGALKISDLWLPRYDVKGEHLEEAKALSSMYNSFKEIVK